MENYKELIVRQKAMDLAETVYKLTDKLPREETYVLSDQMRRAAISVPSNIAEGYGRKYRTEYARFLNFARGSKNELETQLFLCVRMGLLSEADTEKALELCYEIGKMLNTLIAKLI